MHYHKIKTILFCFLVLIIWFGNLSVYPIERAPQAKKGILDLQHWNLKKNGPVPLYGEWRFYWQSLLFPDSKEVIGFPEPSGYLRIPRFWNGFLVNGKPISGQGFATFSLTVILPPGSTHLAIKLKDINTSFRLFVDGKELASSGKVGTDKKSSTPFFAPQVVEFNANRSKIEILIQISNFYHHLGGIWEDIELGEEAGIRTLREDKLVREIFLMGCIFIMGLYHLSLFLNRKKDRSALYFALYCLIIAIRTLTLGERYFVQLFSIETWEVLLTTEYLTFYLSVMAFITFLYTLFPKEFYKPILTLILIISILFSIITIVTPAAVYTEILQIYQAITLLAGIYSIYVLVRAVINKKEGGWIILLGFLFLFLMAINSILHANQIIHTGYFVPLGLLVFIFSQAFLIALRFSKSFITVEKQAWELIKTNDAIRIEIKERKKLEQNLVESLDNFEKSRVGIILGLAKLAEYRDVDTGTHLERMREYSKMLAEAMSTLGEYKNYISAEYIEDLFQSAILHDIGKVGIPDAILLKPSKLTPIEFEIMKQHSVMGGDAIFNIESRINMQSFLTLGKEIAYSHHERWDGSGYPKGLKQKEIPLSARIIALADVYDALTSERPYKKAFTHEKSRAIILKGTENHFDPTIVEAFLSRESEFKAVRNQFQDESIGLSLIKKG